jgi:hypothetical protein
MSYLNPMQAPAPCARRTSSSGITPARLVSPIVHLVRLRQRVRVRHDDGVDGRAVLVVGVDATEILLDQAAAGDLAGPHRRVDPDTEASCT